MRRGELYRVARPPAHDPKRFRVFVVVSRQALIDSRFSTIICAPVYSTRHGLATQVDVGLNEGLRNDSSVHCDELVSLRKSQLTQFVGTFDTRPGSLSAGQRSISARALSGRCVPLGHCPPARSSIPRTRANCYCNTTQGPELLRNRSFV